MGGSGIRTWLLVGGGLGVLAALLAVLTGAMWLSLLLEALLALVAGAVTAILLSRAPAAAPRAAWVRNGAWAGAAVGVLAGIAFAIVQAAIINSPGTRDQLASSIAQLGGQAQGLSADTVLGLTTGAIGCCYVLVIPVVMAGLGALGAWLAGLTRPAGAAPPVPPASNLPPLPPTPGEPGETV